MRDLLSIAPRVTPRREVDGSNGQRKAPGMTLVIGLTIVVTLFAAAIAVWMIALQGATP
jgi:hypothetical protein